MIKVFFDGKCNLCSKEINYYIKIAPSGIFDWQDINSLNDDFLNTGIKISDALKILHVIDTNNKLHLGIDAFIVIWNNLAYWKILAKVFSIPIIRQIANIVYKKFANWRFNRLPHCILAKNNDDQI
jgi:predicted DCC family thiol-disulfide oxidoreductase YuxK|tara:strand:+ start:832 stop:1209 length:378 start_codon:yes stop_codon:yes gene_type:complete